MRYDSNRFIGGLLLVGAYYAVIHWLLHEAYPLHQALFQWGSVAGYILFGLYQMVVFFLGLMLLGAVAHEKPRPRPAATPTRRVTAAPKRAARKPARRAKPKKKAKKKTTKRRR